MKFAYIIIKQITNTAVNGATVQVVPNIRIKRLIKIHFCFSF